MKNSIKESLNSSARKVFVLSVVLAAVIILKFSAPANADIIFSDNFDSEASSVWGNERGSWRSNGGVYDATNPNNSPLTYSSISTLTGLKDFAIDVDINDLDDGGIWLRSNFNGGNINGVLLVTGGWGGSYNGLYWHNVQNGNPYGLLNAVSVGGIQGSDGHLRVEVIGNTYSAFWNDILVTSLTTSDFSSGSVALYDFSPVNRASTPRGQTFDNVQISNFASQVPEPSTMLLLGIGMIALAARKSKMGKK